MKAVRIWREKVTLYIEAKTQFEIVSIHHVACIQIIEKRIGLERYVKTEIRGNYDLHRISVDISG